MNKYKKVYAVIDNYHENRFPVIAVCNTEDAAEKYIAEHDSDRNIQKML